MTMRRRQLEHWMHAYSSIHSSAYMHVHSSKLLHIPGGRPPWWVRMLTDVELASRSALADLQHTQNGWLNECTGH